MNEKPIIEKVAAYITYQDRLLVFRHVDFPEAGIQVPAGTVEAGEDPADAVLREAREESGLSDLALVAWLGEDLNDAAQWGKNAFYHRNFYHLECQSPPPERWRAGEAHPSDQSADFIAFELWWCALDSVPELAGGQGQFLAELPASLGRAAAMRQCFALARSAFGKGNHPFGALLIHNGQVILTAENSVASDPRRPGPDVTRHAESNLVSLAASTLPPEVLRACTLVTSTEPCMMCVGAIYWAGIPEIVYGVQAETLARMARDPFVLTSRFLLGEGRSQVRVLGPVLEAEGLRVYDGWMLDSKEANTHG
jgi:tRNA(Arg) A34 adenosine deaminase TadA/8-oxo-dGTP pyrophosphatase MutT (NUDIX family)